MLLALYNTMYHWGAVIVPPGCTTQEFGAIGGNPYGVSHPSMGGLSQVGADRHGRSTRDTTCRADRLAYNAEHDRIDISDANLAATKKYRDAKRNGRVAVVVIDDVLPQWRPRCVEVRGIGELVDERPDYSDSSRADRFVGAGKRRSAFITPGTSARGVDLDPAGAGHARWFPAPAGSDAPEISITRVTALPGWQDAICKVEPWGHGYLTQGRRWLCRREESEFSDH
ncbi:pyridoxamine 5'-phosphate oxidase family protein [Actinophytocola sp.]|uniref:pyridoxamine 5'-phosphate oxidase family protein n=1 Tax=Actinophytocola sp. TaxID=1872138 RepID=UPI00389A41EF